MNTHNPQTRASIEMVIAMTLSGSIGVFVVESDQPATDVVFYRCLFGFIALVCFYTVRRNLRLSVITLRIFGWMVLSGLTMSANWILFFKAYNHASISSVTIVYHVYPFLLLFAATLFFHEPISKTSFGWAAIAFSGVFCIVGVTESELGMSVTGFILILAAMVFYTMTLLIAKKLKDVPPGLLSIVQLAVGALALAYQISTDHLFLYSAATWGYLVGLGLIHTALLYLLLYSAVQKLSSTAFALLSFLYPVTALLVDVVIYDVRPSLVQLLGMCLILLAVAGEKAGKRISRIFKLNGK